MARRRTASRSRRPSPRSSLPCATASRCEPVPQETPPQEPAEEEAFAGVPDSFGRLWTPHRMAYIKGEGKPSGPGEDEGCPFCHAPTLSDAEVLIVARGALVYAVLNFIPYNGGNVLICPFRDLAYYNE